MVEAEACQRAGLEVLDYHVRLARQFAHGSKVACFVEVRDHPALAAIAAVEIGSLAHGFSGSILPREKRRTPQPCAVAVRALDLDHVGTEVGQRLPGPGACQHAGKFQHLQTGKRSAGIAWLVQPRDHRVR